MTDNAKKLLEKLSADPKLAEQFSKLQEKDVIAEAKKLGIDLTEDDLKSAEGQLSEDELETVAGGGHCYCAVGGGGTSGEEGNACGCVITGFGTAPVDKEYLDKDFRCCCVLAGEGTTPDDKDNIFL